MKFCILKKYAAVLFLLVLLILLMLFSLPAAAAPYKNFKIGDGKTVIEAEDYDTDDWFDTENGDSYAYRPDGAQTEHCSNYEREDAPDENYNIGWSADGEWVQYTVSVEKAGTYKIGVWLASEPANGGAEISYDGKVVGLVYAEESFGWQNWALYNVGSVDMTVGTHVIKMELTVSVNADAIVITSLDSLENGAAQNNNNPAPTVVQVSSEEKEKAKEEEKADSVLYAGYAAAEDLSDTESLFIIAVMAIIIAFMALCGAGAAIIIAVRAANKIT